MQKGVYFRVLTIICAIAAVMFISSCVSRPPEYNMQAFGAVGANADVYIVAPVTGNEPLLKALFTAFIPEKTAMQYLNRTSVLYIGADYGVTSSVTVVSKGSYPVSLGDLLFSKKYGWAKHHAAALNNHTYYSSAIADIVVQEKTAFMLIGANQRDSTAFLLRIAEPHFPVFSPRFQALSESGEANEIGLYTRSGSRIAAALLGLEDIELPIRSIELYLKKDINSIYRCSAVFEATDTRAALVIQLLLRHSINGEFSVQDSSIFVKNADITETELIKMLEHIISKSL